MCIPRHLARIACTCLAAAAPAYGGPPATVTNLGKAAAAPLPSYPSAHLDFAGSDRVLFQVSEAAHGMDMNGDGDQADNVLFAYQFSTATTVFVGVATWATVNGPYLAASVSEFDRATAIDLNGDGDMLDSVLIVHDEATGITTNMALATSAGVLHGTLLCVLAQESAHGGLDLNGNGNATDDVVHVIDMQTLAITNLGVAAATPIIGPIAVVKDGLAAFHVSEARQATDLNGDFDTFDSILHIYHQQSASVTCLNHASYWTDIPSIAGSFVAYGVDEQADGGMDKNGDGDVAEVVQHVFDTKSRVLSNAGLEGERVDLAGGHLVVLVRELKQGLSDLNGDGDTGDRVVHVVRLPSMSTTNLGLAANWKPAISGDRLLTYVQESAQGLDLNGDADQVDHVLHITELGSLSTTNTGFDVIRGAALGDQALVSFRELDELVDLNGDGDLSDYVVHQLDLATHETLNLAITAQVVRTHGTVVMMLVTEEVADFNGDGDKVDTVLFAHDLATGVSANLGVALHGSTPPEGDVFLADDKAWFRVNESNQGNTDLNGDGDTFDRVAFAATLNLVECGPIDSYGTGCAGSFARVPAFGLFGCSQVGNRLLVSVVAAPPNNLLYFAVGGQRASTPLGYGCSLNVALPVAIVGPFAVSGSGAFISDTAISAIQPPGVHNVQALLWNGSLGTSNAMEFLITP